MSAAITTEMRRELLAAWDAAQIIVNHQERWMQSSPHTDLWFRLTLRAFGFCLNGPLNVANGC